MTEIQASHNIEKHIVNISLQIDNELAKTKVDFEKLHALIHKIVMLHMRNSAKTDHQFISDMSVEIQDQARKIQGTYNTWPGLVITVISATVSIAGGAAGLSPFLPTKIISPDNARILLSASQPIGTAGTGIGSLGSIANNRSEGQRQVMQITLQRMQGKEEDRKAARQNSNENRRTARSADEEFKRTIHDMVATILNVK